MVAVAQANVASAQTSMDDAPSDGVVISRVKEPEAVVSPNDTVSATQQQAILGCFLFMVPATLRVIPSS